MGQFEDPGHAISIGLAGGFARICDLRRSATGQSDTSDVRNTDLREHGHTLSAHEAGWRYMRPETLLRLIERTWGWGLCTPVEASMSLYGRRTVGAAGDKNAQKELPGQMATVARVERRAPTAREIASEAGTVAVAAA
jgi:hypothetical protein